MISVKEECHNYEGQPSQGTERRNAEIQYSGKTNSTYENIDTAGGVGA